MTLVVPSQALAAPQPPSTVGAALSWLRAQQLPDGGYAGFSATSDPGATADAAVAFAAAGVDPDLVARDGTSIDQFLTSVAAQYGNTTGGAAKLTLAAVAGGLDPRAIGGVDLVAQMQRVYDAATGLYDQQLFVHAYAILALTAADQPVPPAALRALVTRQASNGGWGFTGSTDPSQADSNTTAVAIEALIAAGDRSNAAVDAGLGYLRAAQTADGSFVYQVGAESPPVGDANSTALAVQALIADGQDPNSDTWGRAVDALIRFQNPSGAFRYRDDTPGNNFLATAQALPAIAGKALPIRPGLGFGHASTRQRAMAPSAPKPGCNWVPQTQHNLCAGFRAFWLQFGGLAVYGYPLTDEFVENGITVQYFERARFEWHPGAWPAHYDVELGLLGDEITAGRRSSASFLGARPSEDGDCLYFPATDHNLCAGFRAYWEHFGGLAVYGMPITEEFTENGLRVQYFERARLEWHPRLAPSHYDVLPGRVGAELLEAH